LTLEDGTATLSRNFSIQLPIKDKADFLSNLTLEGGTDTLSRNVGNNYKSTLLRKSPEERRPQVAFHITAVTSTVSRDTVSEYIRIYDQRIISHKATFYYERTLIKMLL
jgi:hypothetical protein